MNLYLSEKNSGVIVLEASLTFPIIFCLIFFIIEIIKITDTQSSIDSIVVDMSFDFMGSKTTENFELIIDRYRPKYVQHSNIVWYFSIYPDIATMIEDSSFKGGEIFWPSNDQCTSPEEKEYVETNDNGSFSPRSIKSINLSDYKRPEGYFKIENSNLTMKSLSGKSFVLTVVCDYKFSSAFIKKIFYGGSNTVGGEKYLIWSKSVGICR